MCEDGCLARLRKRGFHSIVLDVLNHDRMGRDVRDTYPGQRPRYAGPGNRGHAKGDAIFDCTIDDQ
jgi:hypothetical protein